LEFDPIDGLILHTLNDAKSAYACFRFKSTFFERCTAPPETFSQLRRRSKKRPLIDYNVENSQTPQDDTIRNDDDEEDDGKYLCRVPLRALATVIRPRKGVVSLRIQSQNADVDENGQRSDTISSTTVRSFLSFEFQLQSTDTILTVTHRIQIANETVCQRAVTQKDNSSELVAAPSVWLRLLQPVVQRTNEVALIVRNNRTGPSGDISSSVSATSFHHSTDTHEGVSQQLQRGGSSTMNAMRQASNSSILKTETTIGCEELEEFDFVSNRDIDDSMPESVNDHVVLVFCLKEAKAMLQFCSSVQSISTSNTYGGFLDQPEQAVSISFHWGGKPLIIETTTLPSNSTIGDTSALPYSAMLVLATLDHALFSSERTMPDPPLREAATAHSQSTSTSSRTTR
jgi:Rad9